MSGGPYAHALSGMAVVAVTALFSGIAPERGSWLRTSGEPASQSGSTGPNPGAAQPLAERKDPRLDLGERRRPRVPTPAALRSAWAYARERGGLVSIAVVDTEGELRGRAEARRFSAASTVKAMLLAAELRRLARSGDPLDAATRSQLAAMITSSDNRAADRVYARVGDPGMWEIARAAGMKGFTIAGHWGNAQVTAADMARLFAGLDRVLPAHHRRFAKGLLGSVVDSQRWGIPAAATDEWAVRLKGGWIDHDAGALVHQGAELRAEDSTLALAVLTDAQRSQPYAIETIRGVAARLLGEAGRP